MAVDTTNRMQLFNRHENRPGGIFMQVATADPAGSDLHLDLVRIVDRGHIDLLDANILCFVPYRETHGVLLREALLLSLRNHTDGASVAAVT